MIVDVHVHVYVHDHGNIILHHRLVGLRHRLARSSELLNCIDELRKAKETAEFFVRMAPYEQAEWVTDALGRISPPEANCPAICILDTGVNNGHRLLSLALNDDDLHSYNPDWGVADHNRHGTEMAGLALYGDLVHLLSGSDLVNLTHRLESVKILPPRNDNPPELYGAITEEAANRVVVSAHSRKHIYSMAVSTKDSRDRGMPSSWSAPVDKICYGDGIDGECLFLVSAENASFDSRENYPDANSTDSIHDPGQSWNALTVGAYTEKVTIESDDFRDWKPLAGLGDLSPCSCTSMEWAQKWPIKPDIVMEGGNMAISPDGKVTDYIDSFQLLTTHWQPMEIETPGIEVDIHTAVANQIAIPIEIMT